MVSLLYNVNVSFHLFSLPDDSIVAPTMLGQLPIISVFPTKMIYFLYMR